MSPSKKKEPVGNKIPHKSKKPISSKEKVRLHVNDINDLITDDDIRNAKPDTEHIKEAIDEKTEELSENSKVNEGVPDEKKKITPWDIINE